MSARLSNYSSFAGSPSTNKLKRVATIDSDEDDALLQKSAHSMAAEKRGATSVPEGTIKRVRKRRKVKKTMTYQEGKYMSE